MKKYESIDQFRQIIREVKSRHDFVGKNEDGTAIYQHTSDYPVLKFHGTVKLHGTNAAIVRYATGETKFQSRERELSITADNAGFLTTYGGENLDFLFKGIDFYNYAAIYGEWCGGSIQKGVSIGGLPKMFVVFGLKVDDEWLDCKLVPTRPSLRIFNIEQFPTFDVEIDFNSPELIQNTIIEKTIAVEEECPVGSYFGVSGVGEGIVFTCVDMPDLKFKSKGEKHSASKVKTLASVDVESVQGIKDFVEYACSENRLAQGITYLKENGLEVSQKSTGDYIKWVANDILKEESDTILANKIDFKKAGGFIAAKARAYLFNNLD